MTNNDLPDPLKTADRSLLGNKKHGIMLAGRVIHRHDEIPLPAGNPLVIAPVLMQHHAGNGGPFPTLAMGTPFPGSGNQTRPLKRILHPGVATLSAITPIPPIKMLHVPTTVTAPVQI